MMSRFKKKTRLSSEIPTGTFADISFLLIIFFMVTTTFVVYRGFRVSLPDASRVDTITARRHIANLWIGADGAEFYSPDILHDPGILKFMRIERAETKTKVGVSDPSRITAGHEHEISNLAQGLRHRSGTDR